MRSSEFITEQTDTSDWRQVNLRQIVNWIELQNQTTVYRSPNLNNALLLVGMVGDPKFREKKELETIGNKIKEVVQSKEAFDLMNAYAEDEKITLSTLTRMIKLHKFDNPDPKWVTNGDFSPDGMAASEAWIIRLKLDAAALTSSAATINDNLSTRIDKLRDTFLHECLHRGIQYWKLLNKANLINISKETEFVILDSEHKHGTGDHAVIYNRLSKNRLRGQVKNWYNGASDKVKSSVPHDVYYNKTKLNDLFKISKESQLPEFLDSVYEKLSDEIAQYLGTKVFGARNELPSVTLGKLGKQKEIGTKVTGPRREPANITEARRLVLGALTSLHNSLTNNNSIPEANAIRMLQSFVKTPQASKMVATIVKDIYKDYGRYSKTTIKKVVDMIFKLELQHA